MIVVNTARLRTTQLRHLSALRASIVAVLVAHVAIASLFGQFTVGDKFYYPGRTQEGDVGPVSVHHFSTGEVRKFYTPADSDGLVFDLKASPSGGLVAISTRMLRAAVSRQEATVFAYGKPMLERKLLHIVDESGSEIDTIPQVRSYAWSPDGQRLAYVIGEYRGHDANYGNTSTWIWNSLDKKRRQISDDGHDVTWAKFDNNVYLWPRTERERNDGVPGKAVRYNVSSGRLEATSHISIYFSPTGDYYYHPGGGIGPGPESVYLRFSDQSLKDNSRVLSALIGWRPLGWAPDADLLLMKVSRKAALGSDDESATIIFNPTNDTSVDVTAAEFLGWGGTANQIVVRNGTRIEKKTIAELQVATSR